MYETVTLPKLITVAQARQAFGIGESTLRKAYQTGALAAYHPNGRDILLDTREIYEWAHTKRYKTNRRN